MGFQDRDYYRESTRHFYSDWFGQRAAVMLVAVTVAVYILQLASRSNAGFDRLSVIGAFHAPSIFAGQVWRLITPVFLHAPNDPMHLIFNMIGLYMFGTALERTYGSREFVGFYFAAALFGGVLELLIRGSGLMDYDTNFGKVSGSAVYGIGASGAVSALAVVFACKYPFRPIYLMLIPIGIPAWIAVSGFLLLDLAGVARPWGNTNHLAHLCGAAFGLVYHFADLRLTGRWPSLAAARRKPARPTLRLVPREDYDDDPTPPQPIPPAPTKADEQLEAQMDRVLAKMGEFGRDSLTADENAVLLKASELYKQKRRGN